MLSSSDNVVESEDVDSGEEGGIEKPADEVTSVQVGSCFAEVGRTVIQRNDAADAVLWRNIAAVILQLVKAEAEVRQSRKRDVTVV